jgi:hypothetical protein
VYYAYYVLCVLLVPGDFERINSPSSYTHKHTNTQIQQNADEEEKEILLDGRIVEKIRYEI